MYFSSLMTAESNYNCCVLLITASSWPSLPFLRVDLISSPWFLRVSSFGSSLHHQEQEWPSNPLPYLCVYFGELKLNRHPDYYSTFRASPAPSLTTSTSVGVASPLSASHTMDFDSTPPTLTHSIQHLQRLHQTHHKTGALNSSVMNPAIATTDLFNFSSAVSQSLQLDMLANADTSKHWGTIINPCKITCSMGWNFLLRNQSYAICSCLVFRLKSRVLVSIAMSYFICTVDSLAFSLSVLLWYSCHGSGLT